MTLHASMRRLGVAAALGLALAAVSPAASFAQSSGGSISGGGDDAQSNSGAGQVAPAPGAAAGSTDGTTFRSDSISGNGDDAQSNSTGSAMGTTTGAAGSTNPACDDAAAGTASATLCNQQSGDDAESASGLPQAN